MVAGRGRSSVLLLGAVLSTYQHCASASRLTTKDNPLILDDGPLITVHDIDEIESKHAGKPVHTEENCENCFQGDILVPDSGPGGEMPPSSMLEEREGYNMTQQWLARGGKPWPNGVVQFKWKEGVHPKAKEAALAGMRLWEAKTCILFREASPDFKHPLTIGSDEAGCHAHAGFYDFSKQKMNLGEGCWMVGVAAHELGHVIGLQHEQEREDRDEYVNIHNENIIDGMQQWFAKNPWRDDPTKKLPYDLASIMHYDEWAFAKKVDFKDPSKKAIQVVNKDKYGNCKTGQRSRLSIGDQLTVAQLYGCPHQPEWSDAEAFVDPSCQDDKDGYRGLSCEDLVSQAGTNWCYYPQVQTVCPRSCNSCAAKPFC
mmetsp:Transcript_31729/g.74112  ORF Transcript_31729/g.74112 Transcript_31729/m.74112 type:complete len:371 (-) Transcript_31729:77-1189(-)